MIVITLKMHQKWLHKAGNCITKCTNRGRESHSQGTVTHSHWLTVANGPNKLTSTQIHSHDTQCCLDSRPHFCVFFISSVKGRLSLYLIPSASSSSTSSLCLLILHFISSLIRPLYFSRRSISAKMCLCIIIITNNNKSNNSCFTALLAVCRKLLLSLSLSLD